MPSINKVVFGSETLIDISDATAVASDVAIGKIFYLADGTKTTGTASGGEGGLITIEDVANATGTTCAITTSSEPTPPEPEIPLNVQLVTNIVPHYIIYGDDGAEHANEWGCCSDFIKIDPSMTFEYIGYQWWDMAFYDSSQTFISGVQQSEYADTVENDYAHGTITPIRMPGRAEYIRISSYPYNADNTRISLIRVA